MNHYQITALAATFGAKVSGLDLSRPVEPECAHRLVAELEAHRLLVFEGQDISHAHHLAVSRLFGSPESHVQSQYTVEGFPEIVKISNIFQNGRPIGLYDGDDEEEWHTDYSWKKQMSTASLLYSVIAPEAGGATRFADTTAAYDELDNSIKQRIACLRAVHSLTHLFDRQLAQNPEKVPLTAEQLALVPDVTHPLVRRHPTTGRDSLLLGSMIICGIAGMAPTESEPLLAQLLAHAISSKYVYTHQWDVGDLVIWDNRATMHTASPCDHKRHRRLLYRTTVM
ncbi:TauD/TfdA family dioxygenase [Nocardia sp. CDC159]|uniref:TauD/TfdA family dioxygenase n=1 Tax=Nocardia pulmonis TaxID=2951408 RepID=A0A9X2E5F7_9NOCA|nr:MULTISPECIES: TauD/TfdA family dioxygenase [Nocardia]MCM6774467.1 TauD/TfdA family dioxygenase [Nocardia pulmonis]MCM6787467.1 TauD/TfdA family dioxygenase [Nocardia sp. CDC159]